MDIKMTGIDVSHWQEDIDFETVKKSGVDFVIIKAGGSDAKPYKDSYFDNNYEKAKAAGLHVGAYYFVGSKCITAEDGKADAERFIKLLKDKQFDMPVYIDLETTSPQFRQGATDAVIAFCEHMESKGYYVGIYASDTFGFRDKLVKNKLDAYDKWVARYGKEPQYMIPYGMWQYGSRGRIAGIAGHVDMNRSYKDYPSIIKKNKLNGFK